MFSVEPKRRIFEVDVLLELCQMLQKHVNNTNQPCFPEQNIIAMSELNKAMHLWHSVSVYMQIDYHQKAHCLLVEGNINRQYFFSTSLDI